MNAISPWADTAVPVDMTDETLKKRFAELLHMRPDNPTERFNAAKLLFPLPNQVGLALQIASDWPSDPIVIAELDRLGNSGTDAGLPTKADIARRYINFADDKTVPLKERMTALNAFTELMGMKPVPGAIGAGGIGIHVDNRRVFVLPSPQPMDAWEQETVEQQAKLIEGNVRRV